MAKLKRKFIKMPVEEESSLDHDTLVSNLDSLIETQYRRNLNKLKGSPLCLWSKLGDDRYRLRYYRSYKSDMCDTQLNIDIEKGLERCSVRGLVNKPAAIWACFWGVIASVMIDFMIISWLVLFGEGFDLAHDLPNALMISGAVCLVRIYLCTALIEIDRSQVKILREELLRVIRDKKDSKPYYERTGDESGSYGDYEYEDEDEINNADETEIDESDESEGNGENEGN